MKKIKTSKKVKGMTLIEVIISMLVFGVTGVIMVGVCTVATTMMKETNHLNNKTDAEAPVAAVRDVDALRDASGAFEVAVDNNGNAITVEDPIVVIVGHANAAGTGMSSAYDTYTFNKYSTASVGAAAVNANTNMNADLEFYVQVP